MPNFGQIIMREFIGKTFENADVGIDGNSFTQCVFKNCRLIYSGGDQANISNCDVVDSPIVFTGAALNTLHFLHGMNSGGFRGQIHSTIVKLSSPEPLKL
jgi:hypothetical protein